jgi:hypothetical protein
LRPAALASSSSSWVTSGQARQQSEQHPQRIGLQRQLDPGDEGRDPEVIDVAGEHARNHAGDDQQFPARGTERDGLAPVRVSLLEVDSDDGDRGDQQRCEWSNGSDWIAHVRV